MHKSTFTNMFTLVPNNEGNLEWNNIIEVRMYTAKNPDVIVCSLVEENGLIRLYEGDVENDSVGYVVIEPSDYKIPTDGVDWSAEGGSITYSETTESEEPTVSTPEKHEDEEEDQIRPGHAVAYSEENSESKTTAHIEKGDAELGRGEVVFSADSINMLLDLSEEVNTHERAKFVSIVGVQNPTDAIIMDIPPSDVEPVEQIEIIDTGRISEIVEFNQDRYNIDIVPNEITNIPLGTKLLRHDAVVLEDKTYYFAKSNDRSIEKINSFIKYASDKLAKGEIVTEPLTQILDTPKGEIKTFKYFLSEVQEIAGRLRKYSPKIVGVEGEFQLVIGQYWSL